jgi:hypothetical protein
MPEVNFPSDAVYLRGCGKVISSLYISNVPILNMNLGCQIRSFDPDMRTILSNNWALGRLDVFDFLIALQNCDGDATFASSGDGDRTNCSPNNWYGQLHHADKGSGTPLC